MNYDNGILTRYEAEYLPIDSLIYFLAGAAVVLSILLMVWFSITPLTINPVRPHGGLSAEAAGQVHFNQE